VFMYEHEHENLKVDYNAPVVPIEILTHGYIVAAVLAFVSFCTL
jgi:hypothetical protein